MLKKIEERKRQRAAANNKSILDLDQNNLTEDKKKKKDKKKKTLLNTDETNDSNIDKSDCNEKVSEQTTETVKTSTKKKRKKKDIESEHFIAQNEELEEKDKNPVNGEENPNTAHTTKKEIPLQNDFVVLGTKSRKKQREVKRVLPDWLAHPEVICADLNSGPSLEELNSVLDAKLIEVLRANGIVKLFPVQSSIIKWLHKCNMDRKLGRWLRDTCVSAPTGSGKYPISNNIHNIQQPLVIIIILYNM